MSDYLRAHRCDLVKLDVEGAETAGLAEVARAGLLQRAHAYVVECHPRRGTNPAVLRALFADAGFVCQYTKTGPEADKSQGAAGGAATAPAGPGKGTVQTRGG